MTILATTAILQALDDGAIICAPVPSRIEGAHVDVTLGQFAWVLRNRAQSLALEDADPREWFMPMTGMFSLTIPANGFALTHTAEAIGTAPGSGLVPMLHTRSTLARWGLSVCTANAGQGDEGYAAPWTLEVHNPFAVPVTIPIGARIGAISFHRLEGSATPYQPGTRYNVTRQAWTPEDMLPRRGNW